MSDLTAHFPSAFRTHLRGPSALLWGGASALVLLVHAGALAAMLWRAAPAEMDEEDGAPIVLELAEMASAPVTPPQDGDPGIDSDESVQQQVTRQVAEAVKTETVEATESPTPPDPDLEFAKKTPEREAKEAPPEAPVAPKQAETESAASAQRIAAAPSVEAPPGPTLTAPVAGSAQQIARATKNWQNRLLSHLNKHKLYPEAARARRETGEAQVRMKIDRSGRLLASAIVKSSGHPVLDAETLAMLRRSDPVPIVPMEISGETIELVVPVRFRAKDP